MMHEPSLRERKKLELRRLLSGLALDLFSKRGFDAVTVAEIAAAANVSEKTVFNHFVMKEDLLLACRRELWVRLVEDIRERSAGIPVFAVVRQHVLSIAEQLQAAPAGKRLAFAKVVRSTPAIHMRLFEMSLEYERQIGDLLAGEVGTAEEDPTPWVVASLIGPLSRLAFGVGWGGSKSRTHAQTLAGIEAAFDLLEEGLAGYGARKADRPVRSSK